MPRKNNQSPITGSDTALNVPYRVFFEYAKFPMMLIDEDTTIVLCNRAFEQLIGYSKKEIEGVMSWTSMISGIEQLEKMKEYHHTRRIDPSSAPEEYQFQMTDRKGDSKDIVISITMVPDTRLSLAFLQDITEKNRTEIWYKAVFENTGLPSIIIAPDTKILKANSEFCILSGYTKDEIENRMSWTIFIYPDDVERMKDYHLHRRDDERQAPRKYEFRFVRKDGTLRNIANSVTMIPGSTYSIASLMDITDLREAETERKKLEDQLHQARKLESIGQLAGGIAHDFNNMLAAILGYSQIIQLKLSEFHEEFDKSNSDISGNSEKLFSSLKNSSAQCDKSFVENNVIPVIKDFIGTAEEYSHQMKSIDGMIDEVIKAASHAAGLTRQLLAFARKQTLEVQTLNLNKVITDFEKILRRTIRENVVISTSLHPLLNFIEADIGQVEQIILNLALNARDAMPDGGTLLIKTGNCMLDRAYAETHEGVVPGKYVKLEISDTGTGMDNVTQSKVFEPFFTTKEPGKGTGLGLATVYGIVRQHMGHIWLYSEPGKGTTFNIYFPQAAKQPEKRKSSERKSSTAGADTIMVVEDQEQVRKMICLMLKQQGYFVLEAENGQKGIETAMSHNGNIDLLITDVVMPGLNGKELYNELIKSRPGLKVLFISGYPREIISYHGILEEGLNFLQKPVPLDLLTKKIREIIENGKPQG
ncbi:MAG TPA: PAS domain S-box protein [Spirochaetota bacterium]|nr:PAS domain S-box protein [Spirochaetota bacterium]